MIDRRKFITSCAAGAAVLTTPAVLRASIAGDDSAPSLSVDTFRPLVGQRLRCMTDLGYSVRLRLKEIWDGPQEIGVDQFTLLLKERGRTGPHTLEEGIYTVFHSSIGNYPMYLWQSQSRPRHYVTSFGLLY